MQIENIFSKTKAINLIERMIPPSPKAESTPIKSDALTLDSGNIHDGSSIKKTMPSENYTRFQISSSNKGAPYSELADENGKITYNGVTFVCDNNRNMLCLGDVSSPADCLTIPLADGGCLRVNRNSLDDLSKAIGMFSPEDVKRILDAIATDKKVQEKQIEKEKKGAASLWSS